MEEKKRLQAEIIFNSHSWRVLNAISPSKEFCLAAMKEYSDQQLAEYKDKLIDSVKKELDAAGEANVVYLMGLNMAIQVIKASLK